MHKLFIRHMLYPMMERWKGNRTRAFLHELRATERLSQEEIIVLQKKSLAKLLHHAIHTVPAYRPYQQEMRDIIDHDPIQALQRLPLLDKITFNQNRDAYLSTTADRTSLILNRTGGSTGNPAAFYMDRYTVEHYEAARWRGLSWHDIHIGDPSVMVWGSPIELSQRQKWTYEWKERLLKNRIMISAFDLQAEKIHSILTKIRDFRPAYMYGYASALFMLAKLIRDARVRFPLKLKGVVSTSETLHEYQRELMREVFRSPVINEYGARDGGIIAYECSHGKMHIQAENLWLETVDIRTKQPLSPGEDGLLVVTDLHNFAMPRLRYEIGDYGAISYRHCACGLGLPILDRLSGRVEELFVTKHGKFVHGQIFAHMIRQIDGVEQYQVVQHDVDNLTLKVVASADAEHVRDELDKIASRAQEVLEGADVQIEFTDSIPPSASGKLRTSIREFDLHEVH